MPAVTVETPSPCPAFPRPTPRRSAARSARSPPRRPASRARASRSAAPSPASTSRDLDPFIHMDQMGEVDYAPGEPKGTAWHPHRGFETVTYMIDGTFEHQDSNGGGGVITNGDTQWMTAGGGILHIETPPEELVVSGGLFHGIQLWVNLPQAQKMVDAALPGHRAPTSRAAARQPDGGALRPRHRRRRRRPRRARARPTRRSLVHATVAPGAQLDLPWRPDFNALVYVLAGAGTVGADGAPGRTGQLAVFGAGDTITVSGAAQQESRTPALDVLILGGRPIREPVASTARSS